MNVVAQTHLGLWFFSIILSLLHGSGHLVHGGDDGVAGLAHTVKAARTMGAIHLEERVNVSLSALIVNQQQEAVWSQLFTVKHYCSPCF